MVLGLVYFVVSVAGTVNVSHISFPPNFDIATTITKIRKKTIILHKFDRLHSDVDLRVSLDHLRECALPTDFKDLPDTDNTLGNIFGQPCIHLCIIAPT